MRKYGFECIDLREVAGYIEIIKQCERGFYFSATFYDEQDRHNKIVFYYYNFDDNKYDQLAVLDGNVLQSETYYCITACFINEQILLYPMENDGILELIEANLQTGSLQKTIVGEYSLAFVCQQFLLLSNQQQLFFYDRTATTWTEILDQRLVLSNHDRTEIVECDGRPYLVFEQTRMDSYELEEFYQQQIPKEQIYDKGYLTSVNFMPLNDFVREVHHQSPKLSFTVIQATNYDEASNYVGYDQGWIYYTKTSFATKVLTLSMYSIVNGERRTITKAQYTDCQNSCNMIAKIAPVRLIKYRFLEDCDKIQMFYPKTFIHTIDSREHFLFLGEGVAINQMWDEDDQGENYREFIRVRDINTWEVMEELDCGVDLLGNGRSVVLTTAVRY